MTQKRDFTQTEKSKMIEKIALHSEMLIGDECMMKYKINVVWNW